MAQLAINFVPVPGISSYTICYRPVGATTPFVCVEDSGSITITEGIECGIAYDVSIRTNCNSEEYSTNQSTSVVTTSNTLACTPPPGLGYCHRVDVPYEDLMYNGQMLYLHFMDPIAGYQLINTNMIPVIDTGSGYRFAVCTTDGPPTFRYGYDGYDQVVMGIIVQAGGPCNDLATCMAEIQA